MEKIKYTCIVIYSPWRRRAAKFAIKGLVGLCKMRVLSSERAERWFMPSIAAFIRRNPRVISP